MPYGMRTKGAGGNIELDENSFTVRIIYSGLVTRSAGGGRYAYIAIPEVSPSTHSAVCIPIGAYPQDQNAQNAYAVQYEPEVVAGGVNVWFGNRLHPQGATGLATQRLLVMRYR